MTRANSTHAAIKVDKSRVAYAWQDVKSSSPASGTSFFGRHMAVFSPFSFLPKTSEYSLYQQVRQQVLNLVGDFGDSCTYLGDLNELVINPICLQPFPDKISNTAQDGNNS
jgi:hypothetical protein